MTKSLDTNELLNRALLYGYQLANGRYWFSVATPDSLVNVDYATLEHQGYIIPYQLSGNPTNKGGYWQWDYEITQAGFERIKVLQEINKISFIAGEE